MQYVEMPIKEAIKKCKENATVLVAEQDLMDDDVEIIFVRKKGNKSDEIFCDVKTVGSLCDEFVKRLDLFTEKQDLSNIKPYGIRKIVILRQ